MEDSEAHLVPRIADKEVQTCVTQSLLPDPRDGSCLHIMDMRVKEPVQSQKAGIGTQAVQSLDGPSSLHYAALSIYIIQMNGVFHFLAIITKIINAWHVKIFLKP